MNTHDGGQMPEESFEWKGGLESTKNRAESERTSDRIRANIDRTRAQMDETVDELQHRMSLDYVARSGLAMARDAGAATARKIGTVVREHPIPSAVVAAGIIWMIVRKRPGQRSAWHNGDDEVYGEYVGVEQPHSGAMKQRMRDMKEGVKHASAAVKDKARSVGSTITHAATDAGHYARDKAAQLGHQIQHGAHQGKDWFVHTLDEHPLPIVAAFFTLGLAAGLAAPATRKEDQLLGGLRDDLVDRAESVGADLIRKGEETAERAVAAARDAVTSGTP